MIHIFSMSPTLGQGAPAGGAGVGGGGTEAAGAKPIVIEGAPGQGDQGLAAPGAGTTATGAQPIPPARPSGAGDLTSMLPLLITGMLVLFIISLFSRRQDKKKTDMLKTLARRDKVQTIGGAIGTIEEISDTEVVLCTDEKTNTRIRFTRSAIALVLHKHGAPASSQAESKPVATKASA